MMEFEIDIDDKQKKEMVKQLRGLGKKVPRIISSAANKTAVEARKLLAKMAHEQYSVKKKHVKFQKEMNITKAKVAKPTAIIKAKGEPLELYQFDVRPRTVQPKRRKPIKGKVLSASSMKSLQTGNLKAFVAKFSNGHITVIRRTGKERLPTTKLFSLSVPTMLSSEKNVYGVLKNQISEIYKQQCLLAMQKEIDKSKGKGN